MLLPLLLLDLPHVTVEECEAQRYPVTNLKPHSKEGGMEQTSLKPGSSGHP